MEVEFINKYEEAGKDEFTLMQYEFKDGVNKYLSSSNSKMKSLEDVINFNKQNESTAMPFVKQ